MPPAAYQQGYDEQAKQSTRFLSRGLSVTALTGDRSQRATDISAGTSSAYESASSRFNHGSPRTIGVRVSMTSAHTGTLWRRNTAGNTERLAFSGANTVRIVVANATVVDLTVTAPTGTDECVIAWITEANPDTTGAGDAFRSRILHWNVTDGTFTATAWTAHVAISTASSTDAIWGADDSAGTSAFAGTMTAAWFENRVQSGAEIANDWVSTRTAPTSDLEDGHQGPPPDADTFDARNYHHGPAALWAVDATRRMYYRTLSPLVNEQMNTQPAWSHSLLTATDAFIRGAPGNSNWRMHAAWRFLAPVPDNCSLAWVRVHLRSYVTSGAAVPIGVRCYSFNRMPGSTSDGADEPLVPYYVGATVTRDDTSTGLGEYTVLGLLPISRGRSGPYEGRSVFALALRVDPAAASANDANARIVVRAIHVIPCHRQDVGNVPWGGVIG